jgi:hypothetical protein
VKFTTHKELDEENNPIDIERYNREIEEARSQG